MLAPFSLISAHLQWGLIRNHSGLRATMTAVSVEFVAPPSQGRVFRSRRRVHLGDVDASARLRLEAIARYLQEVATDDADDAQLSERAGVWVVRSIDVEIVQRPWYHEALELTTFCSGTGPRWAERRTTVLGEQGARVETVALWVFVDRERGRPLVLDDDFHRIYGEAAGTRRVRGRLRHGAPTAEARVRPWSLRASDFDVLDHVNNARSLEAIEDEMTQRLPGGIPVRARVEYRGTVERGDAVELASDVRERDGAGPELAAWLSVGGDVRVSATVCVGDEPADRRA
jgi:acyl-ACP thioesterase